MTAPPVTGLFGAVQAPPLRAAAVDSPVGRIVVEHDGVVLLRIRYASAVEAAVPPGPPAAEDALGARAAEQIRAYFAGERTSFDLPLARTGTAFQHGVWEALTRIPFGSTRSYGEIAAELGRPGAARAVGQANARNPFPIVVPCHRVLASGGAIGGYLGEWGGGEGAARKRWLLEHERLRRS